MTHPFNSIEFVRSRVEQSVEHITFLLSGSKVVMSETEIIRDYWKLLETGRDTSYQINSILLSYCLDRLHTIGDYYGLAATKWRLLETIIRDKLTNKICRFCFSEVLLKGR